MLPKQRQHLKGGIIMKRKRAIRGVVVVIGVLALLCSHIMVTTALAQNSPGLFASHAAMAMGALAEKEMRANEQKQNIVAKSDVKNAQHSAVTIEENERLQNDNDTVK